MISVKNLSFEYPTPTGVNRILSNILFEIAEGEFVAVMGANGSGKSTLARCLNGILMPTAGEVIVDRFDTRNPNQLIEIRRRVGMVFQHPDNQMVAPTVEREIAFGLENLGVPRKEMHQRVEDMLVLFELKPYRQHTPNQLSGGEKQRVALASVMAMQPQHIIFDEPTSLLDYPSKIKFFNSIYNLRQQSSPLMTTILITQFPEEALLANRLIVLHEGEVIMDGLPIELFQRIEDFISAGLQVPVEFHAYNELSQNGQVDRSVGDFLLSPVL